MENTMKLNGVRPDVIKLQLFPFSLRDVAATWFDSLPVGSVNPWEELVETFMSRFFPPALTAESRREIIVFKQEGGGGMRVSTLHGRGSKHCRRGAQCME